MVLYEIQILLIQNSSNPLLFGVVEVHNNTECKLSTPN